MSDLISKALLNGLGLASLTKDAIHKTVQDLEKKSNLSEEEGERLIKDLHRRSTKAQKALEKTVETAVNKLLKNLNLAIVSNRSKVAKAAGKGAKKRGRRGRVSKPVGQPHLAD
jgi:polyhydroxyalkanoate synthesis regulator phasin